MRHNHLVFTGILALGLAASACGQGIDPPTRVGRVSDMQGTVSLFTQGASDWTPASLNYPLTTGDALWADTGARAEVHLGSSAVRIAPLTSLDFGEVSDTVTQVRVDEGSIDVHVRYLSAGEIYEIDTPAGVVSLLDQGHYRIDVTPDGRRTTLTVRDGSADLTVGDRDYPVEAGSSATIIGPDRPPVTSAAVAQDDWERWADGRDQREDAVQSTRYVSRDMVGYEDLDDYGSWQTDANYGAVWFPRTTPAGWAPYRYGHWESVPPWGWTWIDDEPWGFAPFHYGRWASVRGRWGWVPGEAKLRPVYAPALVAFVGGEGWSGSASFGAGGAVGWVPLAPGEPFVPAYRASTSYVSRLNINLGSVRIGVNLGRPDINQVQLANRTVPGAVTAVPRDAFEHSRPVATTAVSVRPTDVATVRPSAVPVASGQPVAAPPRGQRPDVGRGGAVAPHPPGRSATQVTPPPPPEFRGRPRPSGQEPVRTGAPPAQPPAPPAGGTPPRPSGPPAAQPTPAPVPPAAPPADRGRGRGVPRPSGPPAPLPTPVVAPPAPVSPPPAPPPPPADRGRGRRRPVPPPPAPTPTPVQPAPPPPAQPTPPPPDRGRGRGRPTEPPPAPTPTPVQPTQPPPPPPPDRGRGRGRQTEPPPAAPGQQQPGRGNPPPAAGATDQQQQQWIAQRKQLVARQAQEDADLAARHQAQLKQLPAGTSPAALQQQQAKEKQAQDERHQRERDQLDKQARKPI